MAQSKSISVFLFFVLILSQIHSIEGNIESQTLQTQKKIYETKTIKHGGELHGDDITNEATLVSPPTPPSLSVSQPRPPPSRGAGDFAPTAPGHSPGVGHRAVS
ncbi:precursor of CEP3-like [Fagus crenata]